MSIEAPITTPDLNAVKFCSRCCEPSKLDEPFGYVNDVQISEDGTMVRNGRGRAVCLDCMLYLKEKGKLCKAFAGESRIFRCNLVVHLHLHSKI